MDGDQNIPGQVPPVNTTNPIFSLPTLTSDTTNRPRILDIINRGRAGQQSRAIWRRTLSSGNLASTNYETGEDPIDRFENSIGTFTSEGELFTNSAFGQNIYHQIGSQIDIKLEDFLNNVERDSLSTEFKNKFQEHVKFDDISVDEKVNEQLTKELGISLTELEIYLVRYKELLQKYFQEVISKEKEIKNALRRLHKLKKWVKNVRTFTFTEDAEENSDEEAPVESEPSTAQLRMLSSIQDFVSERTQQLDAVKLRKEHEISKRCFINLVNLGRKINNVHQNQLCVVCLNNNIDTVLLPCGHTGCSTCVEKISSSNSNRRKNCFICRSTVSKTQKIFFAS